MDLPKPPEDGELKNIIDKLANFVARNGFEFEKMTKEKQKNNAKFGFLFGGQYYSYYQFRLSTEQQINNQQKAKMSMTGPQDQIMEQSLQSAPWQQQTQAPPPKGFGGFPSQNFPAPAPMQPNVPPPQIMPPWQQRQQAPWQQQPPQSSHPANVGPSGPGIPAPLMMTHAEPTGLVKMESDLEREEAEVEKQIQDSENNLLQHRQVLMTQQEKQISSGVESAQGEFRKQSARNVGISLESFGQVLQPIIESCTKDSIASGKTWILANSSTKAHCSVIVNELLFKVSEALKKEESFTTQLHIIYLINDVLHHASRKNLTLLSQAIESVIVPIFATTQTNASEDHQERLTKLLGLWNRFKYFSNSTMEELSEPAAAMNNYKEEVRIKYSHVIDKVKESIESQYKQYEKQHEEYARHIKGQVEEKRRKLEEQKMMQNPNPHINRFEEENKHFSQNEPPQFQDDSRQLSGGQPPWSRREGFMKKDGPTMQYDYEPSLDNYEQSMQPQQQGYNRSGPPPPRQDWQQPQEGPGHYGDTQARGQWGSNPSGPAPRDSPAVGMKQDDSALIPKAPYFDLPAGLMAPLVKLEETDYRELDPTLIRLPAPVPPSERLLAAVEAFYSPPSHDRPRNPDGWEQNGLFEFFRAKMRAKRRIQDMNRGGTLRSPSRSPSRSPKRRSYSRSRSRSYSRSRSRSRSTSSSRSRSSRSRSRSRSRSPDRAPTPPTFSTPSQFMNSGGPPPGNRIQEDNRGAQMMRRMGWGGAGLGSSEQGRQDPVQAGDTRDKYDQFKGLGMDMNDPYESFRKNRSQGYVSRIRGNME